MSSKQASTERQQWVKCASTMGQRSVNDLLLCTSYDPTAVRRHILILTILAACVGKNPTNNSAMAL
jgi:hypothetical protein